MAKSNNMRLGSGRSLARAIVGGAVLFALVVAVVEAAEQIRSLTLRSDAPASYTVKQGDTLWDIAGRFLEQPWMWPQVWQVNPQIQNPDLIYPGDTISLSYQDGKPVLSINRGQDSPPASAAGSAPLAASDLPATAQGIRTERRSPQIRSETLLSPIPAIPLNKIYAFMSKSSVVDAETFEEAPYLIGEQQGRNMFSKGNQVYARGSWDGSATTYDIVRKGRSFKDPDSKEILGVESILVGTASISSFKDDQAMMNIETSLLPAKAGDRLIVRQQLAIDDSYLPKPPDAEIDAAIASFASGHSLGGQYDTLVLNKGSGSGLEAGHVLTIQKQPTAVRDEIGKQGFWENLKDKVGMKSKKTPEFPGEKIGTVLIYRVYKTTSLALVLDTTQEIKLNYRVTTPQ